MAAGNIKGITIQIGSDTAPLDKALTGVNATSKKLQTELKSVEKLLKLDPSNTVLLSQKQKILADNIGATSQKLDALKQAEKQAQVQFKKGEISEEQYRDLQQAVIRTEQSLKGLEAQADKANVTMAKISLASKNIADGAGKVAKGMAPVSIAIGGIGIAAVNAGMNYESGMSKVQAISGATAKEFEKLDELALQLGKDTAFSASEAAQGMENLASAGFAVNEIIVAMPGMLDLAASGGLDVAVASDIASSALRGFGLEAEQSGHVADVLAQAAADTNASVVDMGEALKYAAPPAAALGMTLEEVSAAVGIMANAGIKGSQAGTTLRGSLISLASPSKDAADLMKDLGFNAFDSQGKMLPFKDVIDRLQASTKNLSDEKKADALATIFGKEALSGMMVVMNSGSSAFDDLTQSFKDSDGAAQAMAGTMLNNGKGSLDALKGSIETAAITMSKILAPTIRKIIDFVTEMVNKFGALTESTQTTILIILGLVAAIAPLAGLVSAVATVVGGLISVITVVSGAIAVMTAGAVAATPAVAGLAGVLTFLTGPVGLVLVGITAIAGASLFLKNNAKAATDDVRKLTDASQESAKAFDEQSKKTALEATVAGKLSDELYILAATENRTNDEKARMTSLVSQLNKLMPELNLKIDKQTGELNKQKTSITDLIKQKQVEMQLMALESRMLDVYKEGAALTDAKAKAQARLTTAHAAYADATAKGQLFLRNEINELAGAMEGVNLLTDAETANALNKTSVEKAYADLATGAMDANKKIVESGKDTTGQTAEQAVAQAAALQLQKESVEAYMKDLEASTKTHLDQMGGIEANGIEKSKITAAEVKRNLLAQIKDFGEWQAGIKELAKRVPEDVMIQLRALGPGARPLIAEYNKMSDIELAKTVGIFRDKTAAAVGAAKAQLGPLPGEMYATGRDAGQGFANGLNAKLAVVKAAAAALGNVVPYSVRRILEMESPSKVMKGIGAYASEGLAIGITDNLDKIKTASGLMSMAVLPTIGSAKLPGLASAPGGQSGSQSGGGGLIVNIATFANNRAQDVQQFAEELEFYRANAAAARGRS